MKLMVIIRSLIDCGNETIPLTILHRIIGSETKYTTEVNETISLNESIMLVMRKEDFTLRIGKAVRTVSI